MGVDDRWRSAHRVAGNVCASVVSGYRVRDYSRKIFDIYNPEIISLYCRGCVLEEH